MEVAVPDAAADARGGNMPMESLLLMLPLSLLPLLPVTVRPSSLSMESGLARKRDEANVAMGSSSPSASVRGDSSSLTASPPWPAR